MLRAALVVLALVPGWRRRRADAARQAQAAPKNPRRRREGQARRQGESAGAPGLGRAHRRAADGARAAQGRLGHARARAAAKWIGIAKRYPQDEAARSRNACSGACRPGRSSAPSSAARRARTTSASRKRRRRSTSSCASTGPSTRRCRRKSARASLPARPPSRAEEAPVSVRRRASPRRLASMVYEAILLFARGLLRRLGVLLRERRARCHRRRRCATMLQLFIVPCLRRLFPVVLAARRPDARHEGLAHPAGGRHAAQGAGALRPRHRCSCRRWYRSSGRCSIATGSSCTTASPERAWSSPSGARPTTSSASPRRGTRRSARAAAETGGQFCSRPMCENRLFSMWKKMPSMMPRNTLTPTAPARAVHVGEGQRERHHHERGERIEQLLPQRDLVALGLLPVAASRCWMYLCSAQADMRSGLTMSASSMSGVTAECHSRSRLAHGARPLRGELRADHVVAAATGPGRGTRRARRWSCLRRR